MVIVAFKSFQTVLDSRAPLHGSVTASQRDHTALDHERPLRASRWPCCQSAMVIVFLLFCDVLYRNHSFQELSNSSCKTSTSPWLCDCIAARTALDHERPLRASRRPCCQSAIVICFFGCFAMYSMVIFAFKSVKTVLDSKEPLHGFVTASQRDHTALDHERPFRESRRLSYQSALVIVFQMCCDAFYCHLCF